MRNAGTIPEVVLSAWRLQVGLASKGVGSLRYDLPVQCA
jgi:hypothetical protein